MEERQIPNHVCPSVTECVFVPQTVIIELIFVKIEICTDGEKTSEEKDEDDEKDVKPSPLTSTDDPVELTDIYPAIDSYTNRDESSEKVGEEAVRYTDITKLSGIYYTYQV